MRKHITLFTLRCAMLLVTLAFTTMATAQTGGRNKGRSNSSGGCCKISWRPVLPPTTQTSVPGASQERRAAPETQPLFGGNEREGTIDVTVLNAAGQAQDPSKWSLSKDGETMLVDISKLPKEAYTIQMEAGKSIEEYEVGTDGAKPRLVSAWVKIEILEGIVCCGPSDTSAEDCGSCPASDYECTSKREGLWRSVTSSAQGNAQSRKAAPVPPKMDFKKLGAIAKSCPAKETTFYVYQCASGELTKISKKSDCPEGCFFYAFERKRR